jgi:hypothetical protein
MPETLLVTNVIRILDFAPRVDDRRSSSSVAAAQSQNTHVKVLGTLRDLSDEENDSDGESIIVNAETN